MMNPWNRKIGFSRYFAAYVWLLVACVSCGEDGVTLPPSTPLIAADIIIEDGEEGLVVKLPLGGLLGETCTKLEPCRPGLLCLDGVCDATGNREEGGTCFISAECAEGLVCSAEGLCSPAGPVLAGEVCARSEDCQPGLYCHYFGLAGVCEKTGDADISQSCDTSADCHSGLVCDDALGQCVHPLDLFEFYATPRECLSDSGQSRSFFEVPGTAEQTDEFYRLPFPNDLRRSGGTIDLTGHPVVEHTFTGYDVAARLVDAVAEDIEGFSTVGPVFFRFNRPISLGSVVIGIGDGENDETLALIDITPESPAYGKRMELAWSAQMGPGSGGRYICDNWLMVRPLWARPLRPGTTYAAVLMTGITDSEGVLLVPDDDFVKMLSLQEPENVVLSTAWDRYQFLRDFVADPSVENPILPVHLLNAAVFTTTDPGSAIRGLRSGVYATAPPAAHSLVSCSDVSTVSPCDDGLTGEEHVRGCFGQSSTHHEIHGRFAAPIFQAGTPPYMTPEQGGQVLLTGAGVPVVQGQDDLCFALSIPKGVEMPEGGWPVVIFGHGTGGSFRSPYELGIVDELSFIAVESQSVGFAVLTIDQVLHGPRRGNTPHGAELLYFNLANPRGTRGNALQGAADNFQLERLVASLDLDAQSSPIASDLRLDTNHLYYLGHSQGASTGALYASQSEVLSGLVLAGTGAALSLRLQDATSPFSLAAALGVAFADLKSTGGSKVGVHHPIMGLLQQYFQSTDPIGIADQLYFRPVGDTPEKHVLQLWGIGDTFTPDSTEKAFAAASRAALAVPYEAKFPGVGVETPPIEGNWGGITGVVSDYFSGGQEGHFVLFQNLETRRQMRSFFGTAYIHDSGIPTVVP